MGAKFSLSILSNFRRSPEVQILLRNRDGHIQSSLAIVPCYSIAACKFLLFCAVFKANSAHILVVISILNFPPECFFLSIARERTQGGLITSLRHLAWQSDLNA